MMATEQHPLKEIKDIPTRDLLEFLDLDNDVDREEALERLISAIETRYFVEWDLVHRHENGAPLSREERQQIAEWQDMNATTDGQILYIDDTPRPLHNWYEIALMLAPHMLQEPFETQQAWQFWLIHEGWTTLREVINTYGEKLPLPSGIDSPLAIFPQDLQHRLNLQSCFSELGGLGYQPHLSLRNEEEHERIDWFIRQLKQHKTSVHYFKLSLHSLLSRLVLPESDKPIFIQLLTQRLALPSEKATLSDFL